jgi:hypothetical protein
MEATQAILQQSVFPKWEILPVKIVINPREYAKLCFFLVGSLKPRTAIADRNEPEIKSKEYILKQ